MNAPLFLVEDAGCACVIHVRERVLRRRIAQLEESREAALTENSRLATAKQVAEHELRILREKVKSIEQWRAPID